SGLGKTSLSGTETAAVGLLLSPPARSANRTASAFERPGRRARALRLRTLTHAAAARRLADQRQAGVPALSRGRLEFTVENEEEADQRPTRAALAARCAQRVLEHGFCARSAR